MKNIADNPTENQLDDPEERSCEGTVKTGPVADAVEGK